MTTEALRILTPRELADQAIARTAARHGLTTDRVLVPCKKLDEVEKRHAVWLDLICECGWSSKAMGRRLMRCHTTIIYGVRKAASARFGLPRTASLDEIRSAYHNRASVGLAA
jgi:hypothetical protein